MRVVEQVRRGDVPADLLGALTGPGAVVVGHDVGRTSHPDAARSYLGDGRGAAWTATPPEGFRLAIDAELVHQRVPPAVVRRAGLPAAVDPLEVWHRWTRAEVLAKLLDVPILLWVRRHGLLVPDLGPAALAWRTLADDELVVTCGLRLDAGSQAGPGAGVLSRA